MLNRRKAALFFSSSWLDTCRIASNLLVRMSELFDGAHVANRSQQRTQKVSIIDIYDAWNSLTPAECVAVKNPQEGYIDFKCFVIALTDNKLYIPRSIVFACWFEFISPDASSFLREPPLYGAGGVVLTHKRLIFSLVIAIFDWNMIYGVKRDWNLHLNMSLKANLDQTSKLLSVSCNLR